MAMPMTMEQLDAFLPQPLLVDAVCIRNLLVACVSLAVMALSHLMITRTAKHDALQGKSVAMR